MFVICHIPLGSKIPSYFWKVDSTGNPLICMGLKSAAKFDTFKDARTKMDSFPKTFFEFKVYALTIKI